MARTAIGETQNSIGDEALDSVEIGSRSATGRSEKSRLNQSVFDSVSATLVATLGRGTMTVADILALQAGSVIPLDTPLNGLVEIFLKDKRIACGEIVTVGDQFGVRITEIGDGA